MPQEVGQFERRYTAYPRDQHGRKWVAQYDRFSNAPCSALLPHGWSAPWLPADKYLGIDPKDDRALNINYDGCVRDLKASAVEYDRALKAEARKYGINAPQMLAAQTLPDGRTVPHSVILDEIGAAPPSTTFAEAARSGNRWVLGLPSPRGALYGVPAWAAPFLHELDVQSTETAEDPRDSDRFADEDAGGFDAVEAIDDRFADEDEPPLDPHGDLEETLDPLALGGRRVPVRRGRDRRQQPA